MKGYLMFSLDFRIYTGHQARSNRNEHRARNVKYVTII